MLRATWFLWISPRPAWTFSIAGWAANGCENPILGLVGLDMLTLRFLGRIRRVQDLYLRNGRASSVLYRYSSIPGYAIYWDMQCRVRACLQRLVISTENYNLL